MTIINFHCSIGSEKKKTTLKRKHHISSDDDDDSDSANDSSDNESSQSDSDDGYNSKTNKKFAQMSSDANSDPDYKKTKYKSNKIEPSSVTNANIKKTKGKNENSILIKNNNKCSKTNGNESKNVKEKYSKTKNIGLSDSDSEDENESTKINGKNEKDRKSKILHCLPKKNYKTSSSSSESEDSKSSDSSDESCDEDNNSLNHNDSENDVSKFNSKHKLRFASPNNSSNISSKSLPMKYQHTNPSSQSNGQYYPGNGSSNSNSPINQSTTQRLNTMTCYDRAATNITATNLPSMMIANFSMVELQEIHSKIASIQDSLLLQRIVDIIEERNPRCFSITDNRLQFDLLHLDSSTLTNIQRIIEH